MKQLANIMTLKPTTLNPEQTAFEVSEIFNESSFHHLPVVDEEGKVVGLVSRTDLDQHSIGSSLFANSNRQDYTDALFHTLLVEYFMTKNLFTLKSTDTILDAYRLFKSHQFRAIPIVDDDILVGIVTPIDLVKAYLEEE
jgi:CBS domain-containing protein